MSKTARFWGTGAVAAATALLLLTGGASAQQAPATTPATTPSATPTPKAAPKTPVAKKAPSPCADLEKAACEAKAECQHIAATKRKDGKEVKAYCRLKPKAKADAKAKTTTAPPATTTTPAAKTTTPPAATGPATPAKKQ